MHIVLLLPIQAILADSSDRARLFPARNDAPINVQSHAPLSVLTVQPREATRLQSVLALSLYHHTLRNLPRMLVVNDLIQTGAWCFLTILSVPLPRYTQGLFFSEP
jgi:hypothetical protein